MNFGKYTKSALVGIAIALCWIAFTHTNTRPAIAAAAPDAAATYQNVELIPVAPTAGLLVQGGFSMFNRRTGEVACYALVGTTNPAWVKVGPTGHIATVGSEPTNTK